MKTRIVLLPLAVLLSAGAIGIVKAQSNMPPVETTPTSPGQAAFGAISEVVRILKSDASTDWSKVNIEALRQHLIDMDAVVMRSTMTQKEVAGGFESDVTGAGPVIASIQRLATNHASMLNSSPELKASVASLPNGVRVTITARNAADTKVVSRVRGLGFAGMLTEGDHHQPHHLGMARGEMVHRHGSD